VASLLSESDQINGGKNDKFVAFANTGALVMGHYRTNAANLPLWKFARRYTLADNFFMGAFGGSYLNHFWLVCAYTPKYPNADESPAKNQIAVVEPDGINLKIADNSPKSAMEGMPKFVHDGALTPDFYSINTMQPPYQPSAVKPAPDGDLALADPASPTVLPPQTEATIGPPPIFQYHHQPFNYFAAWPPGTAARAEHLKDGGVDGVAFIKAIDGGALPQVTFYKPQGNLKEHPGYADVLAGDRHIADVITHLQNSPQWKHMLVVVTYDENGGFWDHVAPPKADRWGPGSRVSRHYHLAVCEALLCGSRAIRYDLDPALHHQAVRSAEIAGSDGTGRRAQGQWQQAVGRHHRRTQTFGPLTAAFGALTPARLHELQEDQNHRDG
jgi:phospholipase C